MASESENPELNDIRKQMFEKIAKNDLDGFKQLAAQLKGGVNFVDENGGMTPLQHACCKGNKEAVQILLDMGADVNYNQHGADYTPLHFAALSGNTKVCRILLDAGINSNSLNSVSRTAAQMAAFVGNHACVDTINNYVTRGQLEYYTKPTGLQTEPLVSPQSLDAFHEFVIEVNLHPVRIALNLQTLGLLKEMNGLRKALALMCEKEMKKTSDCNELMAFKFHYLSWTLNELIRCEEQSNKTSKQHQKSDDAATAAAAAIAAAVAKHDFIEIYVKRVLKENKQGQLDYMEFALRDCIREFPYRECTIFRQIVAQLGSKDAQPALTVLRHAINGQRGFADEIAFCSSCGNEMPDKKCSKCKMVKYCDRECQRLHWFMHKKSCARLTSAVAAAGSTGAPQAASAAGSIDTDELREELAKMKTATAH